MEKQHPEGEIIDEKFARILKKVDERIKLLQRSSGADLISAVKLREQLPLLIGVNRSAVAKLELYSSDHGVVEIGEKVKQGRAFARYYTPDGIRAFAALAYTYEKLENERKFGNNPYFITRPTVEMAVQATRVMLGASPFVELLHMPQKPNQTH